MDSRDRRRHRGLFVGLFHVVGHRLPRTKIARESRTGVFPDLKFATCWQLWNRIPDVKSGRWNVLQRQLISEAVHHSRINDWNDAIPAMQMRRAFLRQAAALTGFVIVCCAVWPAVAQRDSVPFVGHGSRGSGVRIRFSQDSSSRVMWNWNGEPVCWFQLARFSTQSPASGESRSGERRIRPETQLPLTKSLDDPIFAGRLGDSASTTTFYNTESTLMVSGRSDFKVTVYATFRPLVRPDLESCDSPVTPAWKPSDWKTRSSPRSSRERRFASPAG